MTVCTNIWHAPSLSLVTNEDVHKGGYVGQVSDLAPNASDLVVNGRLDLVNLFPVQLDLRPFREAGGSAATFHLWAPGGGLRFCGVDVQPSAAWSYQTNDVYATTGDPMSAAALSELTGEGMEIDPDDYLGNGNAPGVLAFEAAQPISAYDSLELLVNIGDVTVFRCRLPMQIGSVDNMFRRKNLRHVCDGASSLDYWTGEPPNMPDSETNGKDLFFVHGFNVSEEAARNWSRQVFKRLWLSGSRARFHGITWYGDYHLVSEQSTGSIIIAMCIMPSKPHRHFRTM